MSSSVDMVALENTSYESEDLDHAGVVQLCKDVLPNIYSIGEKDELPEDTRTFLTTVIVNEYGKYPYFDNALHESIQAVVLEQPFKIPSIALLLMDVNNIDDSITKFILDIFLSTFQDYLTATSCQSAGNSNPWNNIKLLLRFFAALAPIISSKFLISVFETLLELSLALNKTDIPKNKMIAKIIFHHTLINVPFLFLFNREDLKLNAKVKILMINAETFDINTVENIDLLLSHSFNKPYPIKESICFTLENVKRVLSDIHFELDDLFKFDYNHKTFNNIATYEPSIQLRYPTIESSFVIEGELDKLWRLPKYNFEVYYPNEHFPLQTVASVSTYKGQLLYDIICDTTLKLEFNRKFAAKQIINLNQFFKSEMFSKMGLSLKELIKLSQQDVKNSTLKLEENTIEVILGLLFNLPYMPLPVAYFHSLLYEICELYPKVVGPVFGRAFRYFYCHLDTLDLELRLRFMDWFVFQIVSFGFSWKWEEWEEDCERYKNQLYHPKIVFIKNVIQKELRATSQFVEVESSIPKSFRPFLLPSYHTKDEMIEFASQFQAKCAVKKQTVANDNLAEFNNFPGSKYAAEILGYFHRLPNDKNFHDLESIIKGIKAAIAPQSKNSERTVITLIIQSICFCGQRSLSHANKYIGEFAEDINKSVINLLPTSRLRYEYIIEAVLNFWNMNSYVAFRILEALRFYRIITNESLVSEIISDDETKICHVLTDANAFEALFRCLDYELQTKQNNYALFEMVFNLVIRTLKACITNLELGNTTKLNMPTSMDKDENDVVSNTIWKYYGLMALLKSLLRKYWSFYFHLSEKLNHHIQSITHIETNKIISTWIQNIDTINSLS